ncbi:MAG: biopolymer transporter ExbD [Phycisphaeraceae bacterium]
MLRLRRHDHAARVELLPLIDVVFLLLTFFIYSLVLTVQAQVLPVELTGVVGTQRAEPGRAHAVTIDRAGAIYWNRQPIGDDELDERLAELADAAEPAQLFVAMEEAGRGGGELRGDAAVVDRGPMFVDLVARIERAGVRDFAIVGSEAPGDE